MQIDFLENQAQQRTAYLNRILESGHLRKLIVAGPGTGKTFTFGAVFKKSGGDSNLALTFIRKLVEEMAIDLGEVVEVKTFHAYCKKLLHERNGRVELIPFCLLTGRQFVILHGFRKKSIRTPEKEIQTALRRMNELLEE